MQVPETINWS